MEKPKHTPGPWKAVEEFMGWAIYQEDSAPELMNDYIASDINSGHDMGEANAKLIASAPDLLEALRVIRDSFWSEGEPLQERIDYLKELAAAAIVQLLRKQPMEKTDWKAFWDRPRHEIMKDFSDRMEELYNMAEGLRDMASGQDKEIFNETRGAIYNLRDKAREQYYNWKPEEQ